MIKIIKIRRKLVWLRNRSKSKVVRTKQTKNRSIGVEISETAIGESMGL